MCDRLATQGCIITSKMDRVGLHGAALIWERRGFLRRGFGPPPLQHNGNKMGSYSGS